MKVLTMNIFLNAEVYSLDGPVGHVITTLLNPTTKKITHLVVAEKNASGIKRLVPFRFIKKTTRRLILLSCTREAVSKMDQLKKLVINPVDLHISYMVLQ
jgi:hypothetical protein